MILAVVFYRYTAARYWLFATAISGASCSFRQSEMSIVGRSLLFQPTKAQLQGSGCAADRASRSDDERVRETADRVYSNLTAPLLFHKPLKLTLYRPSLSGGSNNHRISQLTSPGSFLCAAFFFKRKRVPPARKRVLLPQPTLSPVSGASSIVSSCPSTSSYSTQVLTDCLAKGSSICMRILR